MEAVGFNKIIQSNVTVSLGSTTTLEATLMSGGEEVTVTARPPAVTRKPGPLFAPSSPKCVRKDTGG